MTIIDRFENLEEKNPKNEENDPCVGSPLHYPFMQYHEDVLTQIRFGLACTKYILTERCCECVLKYA